MLSGWKMTSSQSPCQPDPRSRPRRGILYRNDHLWSSHCFIISDRFRSGLCAQEHRQCRDSFWYQLSFRHPILCRGSKGEVIDIHPLMSISPSYLFQETAVLPFLDFILHCRTEFSQNFLWKFPLLFCDSSLYPPTPITLHFQTLNFAASREYSVTFPRIFWSRHRYDTS